MVVHRVKDWLLNASARVAPGAGMIPAGDGSLSFRLRASLRGAVRSAWRTLHWPDYACGWVIPAARQARALAARNCYDWMISVSHPFTGHLVGLLARRGAPGARWLVDIGDPFHLMPEPSPNNQRIYGALNRLVERKVLAGADTVCVTTEGTRRQYEHGFGVPAGKISVIPPLLSLPSYGQGQRERKDGVIRLVYVGTLYRGLRNPERLLALFRALAEAGTGQAFELHFYGSPNDCADLLARCKVSAPSSLRMHGLVPRNEVTLAMDDADVLVNIGNDSRVQLATKVIEYMAMGKPILNLVSIDDDASTTVLENYPAALTVGPAEDLAAPGMIRAVASFVRQHAAVAPEIVEQVRREYSAQSIAERYEALLDRGG